ncbi:MAG: hypothetical protein ACKVX9_21650 [Blastocatellia bacterium]
MTIKEFAEQQGVSARTVQNWLKAGLIDGAYKRMWGPIEVWEIPAKSARKFLRPKAGRPANCGRKKREITLSVGTFTSDPHPGLEYWLRQSPRAKLDAAWGMVVEAHKMKGEDLSESRLQRFVISIEQGKG